MVNKYRFFDERHKIKAHLKWRAREIYTSCVLSVAGAQHTVDDSLITTSGNIIKTVDVIPEL